MSVSLDSAHFWKVLSSGVRTISFSTTRQFKIRYSLFCQLSLKKASELRMSSINSWRVLASKCQWEGVIRVIWDILGHFRENKGPLPPCLPASLPSEIFLKVTHFHPQTIRPWIQHWNKIPGFPISAAAAEKWCKEAKAERDSPCINGLSCICLWNSRGMQRYNSCTSVVGSYLFHLYPKLPLNLVRVNNMTSLNI